MSVLVVLSAQDNPFCNQRKGITVVEKKDLKPGVLVWWTRRSERFAEWSCPCVVTKVDKKSFRVQSLDDFKETPDLRMDDNMDGTSRREMRLCTMDDVEQYFEEREVELEKSVLTAKTELQKRQRTRDAFADKTKKFLTERQSAKT